MQNKEIALNLVCTFLDPDLFCDIEFSSFEIEKDTWVDTELSEHYADILYSASLKSKSEKIFFRFEHKSAIDYKIARQILRYQNQIWDELEKQSAFKLTKLPVVIPIIVYHGNILWGVGQ